MPSNGPLLLADICEATKIDMVSPPYSYEGSDIHTIGSIKDDGISSCRDRYSLFIFIYLYIYIYI